MLIFLTFRSGNDIIRKESLALWRFAVSEKRTRSTLKDIAFRAGVTINTVSLAMRNSPLVAEPTRQRIQKIAEELHYIRDTSAGSLRSGKSYAVALIFGDAANLMFAVRIRLLTEQFRAAGYQVLVFNTDERPELELEAARTAAGRKVDGAIICPCQADMCALDLLEEHCIPTVLLGRHFSDRAADSVVWDDFQGGLLAGNHLVQSGCRDILMLNAPSQISSAQERQAGFLRALSEHGCSAQIAHVGALGGGAAQAMADLWQPGRHFDGIFAFSDLIALETACFLMDKGVRIPEDVCLMGFDDIRKHIALPFSLTSVGTDMEEEARQTAQLLLDRMQNHAEGAPLERTLPVYLAKRTSTTR